MKVLKIAIRSLMHFKWYTAINIVGLALSLACVIVIFRYVYGEITVDRYIPDLDRVYITTMEYGEGEYRKVIAGISNRNRDKNFIDLRESPAIEVSTLYMKNDIERISSGEIELNVVMIAADSNYNKIFDLPVVSGTLDLSAPRNVAVTLDLCRKLFGDEDPLGKVIKLSSGLPVTVTAVIGETSTRSSYPFDLLVSYHLTQAWGRMDMTAVKLHPKQDYKIVNEQYNQFFPSSSWRRDVRFQLYPYKDIYLNSSQFESYLFERGNRTNVILLFGAGVLILLVGVVNFINIYLAVAMRRGREWGMKKVFGARGPQFFTQIWVENTLLVALALLIALSITEMISPLVKNLLGLQQIPFVAFDFALVGIFFVVLPLLTTIIPFIKFSYSMPITSLRSIGTTGGRGLTRKIFLALQYTITIFMIVIAVFFNRQLYGMLNADHGFRTENIIHINQLFGFESDYKIYDEDEWRKRQTRRRAIEQEIIQRMDASPLFDKWAFGDHPVKDGFEVKFNFEDGEFKDIRCVYVDQRWMELFELELLDGRFFDESIENGEMCYKLIATESALKQYGVGDWRSAKLQSSERLWYDGSRGEEEMKTNPPYEILGVTKDFNSSYLGVSVGPVVFLYSKGSPYSPLLGSFREGDKQEVIEFLRKLHDETVGGEFVYSFIEDDMRALYDEDRKVATVFTIFTMIAILISVMGLFSMSLFDIEQRYNEIAIRKVNGATTGQIISMLLRKYVILLSIAFLIAAPAAWFVLTKYLENFAFKTPISWWIFALALLVTAGVSLLTLIVQTKKAAETNPASVIRNE